MFEFIKDIGGYHINTFWWDTLEPMNFHLIDFGYYGVYTSRMFKPKKGTNILR